jgi:uncharacterized protein (TIGR03435 family)
MPMAARKSIHFACAAFLCVVIAQPASAQSPAADPKFEVASLRLTTPLDQFVADSRAVLENGGKPAPNGVTFSGQRVTINGLTLRSIVATAYRTELYRVEGADWASPARVVIQAIMPEGTAKDQLPEMLKALLIERFHLRAHFATREEPAFALVAAKNSPKLNPPRDVDPATCADWFDGRSYDDRKGCTSVSQAGGQAVRTLISVGGPLGAVRAEISADGVREEYLRTTMQQLAQRLSIPCPRGCPGLPVVDRTGIVGAWDFTLDMPCLDSNCDNYATALEKIGLKLEKTTAPIEHLVIDQMDKAPADN